MDRKAARIVSVGIRYYDNTNKQVKQSQSPQYASAVQWHYIKSNGAKLADSENVAPVCVNDLFTALL